MHIKAASRGRPIITTDMPVCREILTYGENGYLVTARGKELLVEVIEKMAMDREMRIRMVRAGREKVLKEYTLDIVLDETCSL